MQEAREYLHTTAEGLIEHGARIKLATYFSQLLERVALSIAHLVVPRMRRNARACRRRSIVAETQSATVVFGDDGGNDRPGGHLGMTSRSLSRKLSQDREREAGRAEEVVESC